MYEDQTHEINKFILEEFFGRDLPDKQELEKLEKSFSEPNPEQLTALDDLDSEKFINLEWLNLEELFDLYSKHFYNFDSELWLDLVSKKLSELDSEKFSTLVKIDKLQNKQYPPSLFDSMSYFFCDCILALLDTKIKLLKTPSDSTEAQDFIDSETSDETETTQDDTPTEDIVETESKNESDIDRVSQNNVASEELNAKLERLKSFCTLISKQIEKEIQSLITQLSVCEETNFNELYYKNKHSYNLLFSDIGNNKSLTKSFLCIFSPEKTEIGIEESKEFIEKSIVFYTGFLFDGSSKTPSNPHFFSFLNLFIATISHKDTKNELALYTHKTLATIGAYKEFVHSFSHLNTLNINENTDQYKKNEFKITLFDIFYYFNTAAFKSAYDALMQIGSKNTSFSETFEEEEEEIAILIAKIIFVQRYRFFDATPQRACLNKYLNLNQMLLN